MRGRGTAALILLIGSLSAGRAVAGVYAPTAETLKDRAALVATMHAHEAKELPLEALGVYVQGVTAADAGHTEDAAASFKLAAELDPSFPEPHLALARLIVFRDPAQALATLIAAFRAGTSSFLEQQRLAANIILSSFVFLIAGFLVLVAYAAVQHLSRLHHATTEIMAPWFPGRHAAMCAALLFFVPVLWRIGGLPLGFLAAGLLWPWMRPGQRRWIGAMGAGVVTAPVVLWAISPFLLSPLDPASVPFLVARANVAAGSPELVASLETARGVHPKQADLCFALASVEKRAGHYAKARKLYEEAQELGSSPAVVQNNLAVIAFLEGNYESALDLFQRSI
ncbi:MAG TPA: tetratricopeptide repeat protein, partial [Candidatus Eisenbacteria bacterium]|nr:tetratricopeptide repeat protein [Candidatus Eisenbacteria bacterium]